MLRTPDLMPPALNNLHQTSAQTIASSICKLYVYPHPHERGGERNFNAQYETVKQPRLLSLQCLA